MCVCGKIGEEREREIIFKRKVYCKCWESVREKRGALKQRKRQRGEKKKKREEEKRREEEREGGGSRTACNGNRVECLISSL